MYMCCEKGHRTDYGCRHDECNTGHVRFGSGNPVRGFLHLLILRMLKDFQMHGGDVYRGLKDKFNLEAPKPIIYALLRRMEHSGFLVSAWDVESGGPAKRTYKITEEGLEYLEESLGRLRKVKPVIDALLEGRSGEVVT
ncbi:MAG: PadR family transcriptional regulator [Thermoproteota archaeon]